MNESPDRLDLSLLVSQPLEIDEICRKFTATCRVGRRAQVDDQLSSRDEPLARFRGRGRIALTAARAASLVLLLLGVLWTVRTCEGTPQADADMADLRAVDAPLAAEAETWPQDIPELPDAVKALAANKIDLTLELLRTAFKKNKDLPPPYILLFQLYRQRPNQSFQARTALDKAIDDDPRDPEAYVLLGFLALQERRIGDAESQFAKARGLLDAFQRSPRRKRILEGQTLSGLAAVAEARREWAAAQSLLEGVLKLYPQDAVAMMRMARTMFQQQRPAESLAWLRKAREQGKESVLTAEAALAKFYEQSGDTKQAEVWMNKAIEKAPNDLLTRLEAANWALQTGRLNEAEAHAKIALPLAENARAAAAGRTIVQADQMLLTARALRGLAALSKKDYAIAEKHLAQAVSQSPNDVVAANNLALALCAQNDRAKVQKALLLANDTYSANPRSTDAAATLAWVEYKNGHLQKADQAIRLAVNASGGNISPDTAYYLAQIKYDLGDNKVANAILAAALKTAHFSMRPEAEALMAKLKSAR